jgi:aminopeptidase N
MVPLLPCLRCALYALVAALLWACAAPGSLAPPTVLHYRVELSPDLAAGTVLGRAELLLPAGTAGLLTLDAGTLLIDAVQAGGSALAFEKHGTRLRIVLPAPPQGPLRIDYHGRPDGGLRFLPAARQLATGFSTSQWMPCLDDPGVRATLELSLRLPTDLDVVANGRLLEQRPIADGLSLSRWRLDQPMPSYLYGFAAAPFRQARDDRQQPALRMLGPPGFSEAQLRQVFKDTADMLDFYAAKAGVPYPGEVYTQVLLSGPAAQEMSGFAVMGERYGERVLADPTAVWLGAHEAAHQWWGNGLTNASWRHFWLNEGIATFMTAAYLEQRFGRAEYLRHIDGARGKFEALRDAGKDKPLVFADWTAPSADDRSIVYDKGAYVTHLLREELGEAAFWAGLRRYTQRHWGQSVTTADFQAAMEAAAGRRLDAFFTRWVLPAGRH